MSRSLTALRGLVLLVLGVVPGALPRPAGAQAGADSTILRGAVYDSLITVAPLQDAEVWLEGTNRTARTDARGRFEFRALEPGRYVLTFFHPILDSFRLSAPPVTVTLEPGRASNVVLATPSPESVHRALCRSDPRDAGVVLGLVRDGRGGAPLPDVSVTAEWTSFVLGGGRLRQEPRVVRAQSDSSGRVTLCGIPTDVAVLLRGQAAQGPSGMLVLDLRGRSFGRADLLLVRDAATGSLTGVVRAASGSLVPYALITAPGTQARAEADGMGRFTLMDVEAGSRIIMARAIGHRATQIQATVRPGATQRLDITLGDSVQILDPLAVTGTYTPYLTKVGFAQRRATLQGHFLDEADIERTAATRFEEVFRMVPGIILRPSNMGYIVEFQRGQGQIANSRLANYCPPSYFIDGVYFPLPPNQNTTLPLVPAEVLGIEVYSNLSSAPPQYQRRDSSCGIILVWTKRGVPRN